MPKRLTACLIIISILTAFCPVAVAQEPPAAPGAPADNDMPPPPPDLPPMPAPRIIPPRRDSGTANTPRTPGTPGTPSTPGTPGASGTPSAPGTPGGSGATVAPGPPSIPSVPGTPGIPQAPRAPRRNQTGDTTPTTNDVAPPGEAVKIIAPSGNARNWTMYRGDAAHTGYTEEQLGLPLKLAWKHVASVTINDIGRGNPSSPAVADGVVYFCAGRRLYAVNAETGALNWRYPAEESLTATIKSSPLVGDDLVYFGGGDGKLYAITKDTGTLAWSFVTKGIMSSSPVLLDDTIYVGSGDDHLYALDARTGAMKWPGGFKVRDDVAGSPAIADGLVYFLSSDMVLYAANMRNGDLRWSVRIGASARTSSPVVAENTVYLAAGNILQAYQAKSGRLKWGIPLPSEVTAAPAVGDGVLYFGCRDGRLFAVTTAGKLLWNKPVDLGAAIYGSPVIAGQTLYVGANRGKLVALDAKTGEKLWEYTVMPSMHDYGKLKYVNVAASPVVSNGTLYVLADDGALHAFRADMPDNTPPQVTTVVPARDSLMPGAPPIEIAAFVSDLGSGVKWDSVTFSLDGDALPRMDDSKKVSSGFTIFPERGIVYYKTPVTQPINPLKDGLHTVSLTMYDWAGNKLDTSWCFTVDNRIRKKPRQTQPGQGGSGGPMGGGEAPPPGF